MLSDWIHGDHLTLVPNSHYGPRQPTLARVTLLMNTNPRADLDAFRSGRLDWVMVPDTATNEVLNDPALASEARQYNELTTFWVQLNTAHPPLDDVLVRRALSAAIDRTALIRDIATGSGTPATEVIPPGMPGFQAGLGRDLGFDPPTARALLAEAGYDSRRALPALSFVFPDTAADWRRAQSLQTQWTDNLGIEVDLAATDPSAYDTTIASSDYDLAFGGWRADYPDPQDWLGPTFTCKAAYNRFNYCDPAFDQLVALADTTSSPDRFDDYKRAQILLTQDVPVAPLFVPSRLVLIQPWVQLQLTPFDEYPGSLLLDRVQILPH
jgi:oligopeptide transport system substrate-binding protein